MKTLSMFEEMRRYSSEWPSALSCSLISPSARVACGGTSLAPTRWATKFLASGTLALAVAAACRVRELLGAAALGAGRSQWVRVARSRAVETTKDARMGASRTEWVRKGILTGLGGERDSPPPQHLTNRGSAWRAA